MVMVNTVDTVCLPFLYSQGDSKFDLLRFYFFEKRDGYMPTYICISFCSALIPYRGSLAIAMYLYFSSKFTRKKIDKS